MKPRVILVQVALVVLMLVGGTAAFAANVAVGPCLPNKVTFPTIAEAVEGVPPGSTIQVCPGVYPEQVVIDKSVTIKGVISGNSGNPVIAVPAGGMVANATSLAVFSFLSAGTPIAAQIEIEGGADVTLNDLTLDATGGSPAACSPLVYGVFVQNSSLTMNGVAVKNQLQVVGATTCFNGGLLVQNDSALATPVKVQNSTFVSSAQAIELDGANITSTLTNNSLSGNPASNANAMSLLYGSHTVRANSINNYSWPGAGTNLNAAAYGIFLECSTVGTIGNNTISGTQAGIFLQLPACPTSGISITNNTVSGAEFIGIDVGQTNGVVQGNDIRTSQTAIRLPGAAAGNTISGNIINDTCAVFGSNPAVGANTILNNTVFNAKNIAITNTTGLCP